MPRAFTDSESASSASSSNSRRGWLGFGRISSVGISRRPVSSRALVERIAARPRPIPRWAPPSPFAAGSATCSHLLGKLQIGHRAGAPRIVADDGQAVAGCFADANVARDHGVEDELGEVLTHLALDVLREPGAAVVHR